IGFRHIPVFVARTPYAQLPAMPAYMPVEPFEAFPKEFHVRRKGVEGTSFRWFFYLKDMKTTEFFRENHRNRKNGISFGNLYFRDTAFFSFRPISFSPHSSRSAKVLFSA
ncbi:hypothetical protein ACR76B_24405, partial [Phocaeicola vulgatus]|uniref:hypothetical protein n=2 Tax=Phocaeicola vulgatus TaxID=821 RepID=UPI003DA358D5